MDLPCPVESVVYGKKPLDQIFKKLSMWERGETLKIVPDGEKVELVLRAPKGLHKHYLTLRIQGSP